MFSFFLTWSEARILKEEDFLQEFETSEAERSGACNRLSPYITI